MAEQQTPTKDQATDAPAADDLLALEEIEKTIAMADPEFKQQLDVLATEGKNDLAGVIEILDISQVEERLPRLKKFIKAAKILSFKIWFATKSWTIEFVKTDLPAAKEVVSETLRQFNYKPAKFKRMVFIFIALCAIVSTALIMLWKKGIPEQEPLFIQSMKALSEETLEYDPAHGQEAFYDTVRVAQNTISMPKMAVNLKSSAESDHPPMAMIELYVEGNSPDVVVEIKAREVEFQDLFLRTMEEFTGAELEDPAGKKKLLDRLAKEANRVTTKGRVIKVLFKTIVLQI